MRHQWTDRRTAVAGLLLANLVPLVGVLGFGWNLHSLLVIYWLESGVVGTAYVAKILRAGGDDATADERDHGGEDPAPVSLTDESAASVAASFDAMTRPVEGEDDRRIDGQDAASIVEDYVAATRPSEWTHGREAGSSATTGDRDPTADHGDSALWIAAGFVVIFAFSWTIYGTAILVLPLPFPGMGWASPVVVAVSVVLLAGHHAVSYRVNYVGRREYERNDPRSVAWEVAPRVIGLHVIVVLGANAAAAIGSPLGALVVLVVVKTVVDLIAHRREHDRAQRRAPGRVGVT